MKTYLLLPVILLAFLTSIFSYKAFLGRLPIPADTIVGLYHPYRDFLAKEYPRGVPFLNPLITDPVRQQYPWRDLVILLEKGLQLPLWNPYSMAGVPLLANFQSASFYPLNMLFFIFPFTLGWTLLIMLQPFLAGLFLYFYLRNLSLDTKASLFGAIAFAFSGFSIAWLEWGTILQTGLWLPLILLASDKIITPSSRSRVGWILLFIFSLSAAFFAGHLQTFFYLVVVTLCYCFARWWQRGRQSHLLAIPALGLGVCALITAIQWIPTLQFILHSARDVDQGLNISKPGWFIPWMHLFQFITPDFFGNPATGNYWGVWNYGELVGYVGIAPLLFALYALFMRRDKKTIFYGILVIVSLLFALPTILAKLPFILNIPFLSTAQPTRLLFITDFSFAVLAALGIDQWQKTEKKYSLVPALFLFACLLAIVVGIAFLGQKLLPGITSDNFSVARHNVYLPILLFLITALLCVTAFYRKTLYPNIIVSLIILVTIFDLFRFGWKFTPFTNAAYLYPQTKVIRYLQDNVGNNRYMTTDSRIFPPNFSLMYHLQSLDGYDPLYLKNYAELIAAIERGKPDIHSPFGFNRIITPHAAQSPFLGLLGVKYVLSFDELTNPSLKKVMEEGHTKMYENISLLPRAFFVTKLIQRSSNEQVMSSLYDQVHTLRNTAIMIGKDQAQEDFEVGGQAKIISYTPNKILIKTQNDHDGFLVLTDVYYPTWKAHLLDAKTSLPIYQTDYAFRGVYIPKGEHTIEFSVSIF